MHSRWKEAGEGEVRKQVAMPKGPIGEATYAGEFTIGKGERRQLKSVFARRQVVEREAGARTSWHRVRLLEMHEGVKVRSRIRKRDNGR